ncbi:MAG: hypothetical protein JXB14_04785 [Candidatus Altiarchaeota archaeon]|nr:hypothetical protein [Candidatus Altiarchaeota archaeon]
MDKKALILLVAAIAVVVYLAFPTVPQKESVDGRSGATVCPEGDDSCLWERALDEEDPDYCNDICNLSVRADCLTDLSYLGPDVCDFIEDINSRDICLNRSVGLFQSPDRGWICRGIWNASIKESCIYSFAQQPDICHLLDDEARSRSCVLNLTYSLAFPSGCLMLLNRSLEAECMVNYSLRYRNFDGCLAATDSGLRYECFHNISKRADALAFCNYSELGRRDNCLLTLSKIRPEIPVCSRLSDWLLRDQCLYDIAISSHNYHACEEIKDGGKHDDCLLEVTKLIKSYIACDSMIDGLKKGQCLAYKG